jgi:hypothetical protein
MLSSIGFGTGGIVTPDVLKLGVHGQVTCRDYTRRQARAPAQSVHGGVALADVLC